MTKEQREEARSAVLGAQMPLFDGVLASAPPPEILERPPCEGDALKEAALEAHEERRPGALGAVRYAMRRLYLERLRAVGDGAYVTGDDAAAALDAIPGPREERRAFLGAVFKERGWEWTGQLIRSTQPHNHARLLYCWRWIGEEGR